MLDKRGLKRPFFYDWAIDGDTIYFSSADYNALCKGNLISNQVEILTTFPDASEYEGNTYWGICKFESYLLLSSRTETDDFLIFDLKQLKFLRMNNDENINFSSTTTFLKNDNIYVVSRKTAQICRINLKKRAVKGVLSKQIISDNAKILEIVRVRNLIYIPINQKKCLIEFNIDNEEVEYYKFPENISVIGSISFYNEQFWITGDTRKLFAWKLNEKTATEVADFPEDIKLYYDCNNYFFSSYVYNDVLWLFPMFSDAILRYDMIRKQFGKFEINGEEESGDIIVDELKRGRRLAYKYCLVLQRYDNKVFFFSNKTKLFYELDLLTNKVYVHNLGVKNIYNNLLYPPPTTRIILEGDYMYGLECLIKASLKIDKDAKSEYKENIGKKIYHNFI